ncbi:hypothetical protein ABFA07_006410 [Porites harrisoni]
MLFVLIFWIPTELLCPVHGQFCSPSGGECRQLEFNHIFDGKRLKNHVIRTVDVPSERSCRTLCYMEPNCVSYNFNKVKRRCELNNSTLKEVEENMQESNPNYLYSGAKNACAKKPCRNKATCQTGFTGKGYRCLCPVGFEGEDCENGIDECAQNAQKCGPNAYCNNTKGGFSCTCYPGYYGDGKNCEPVSSCKSLFEKKISNESKAYPLTLGDDILDIYCVMAEAPTEKNKCGVGGWTLVMKIDGKNNTFHYDSSFWTNKEAFNLDGGKTGFDSQETKLPTYWNTSFTKICLGMRVDDQIKFIVINKNANSLHSLIADGQYRRTSLGRDTWKLLISPLGSLQKNCNKEGFNARSTRQHNNKDMSKARVGILGNNEYDCRQCDSRIGFGTGGLHDDTNTCGNEATSSAADKHIKAMGYILVQ